MKPVTENEPQQPVPANPAAAPEEPVSPARKSRFKGEPVKVEPVKVEPVKVEPVKVEPEPVQPVAVASPQIFSGSGPRYRPRKKTSWATTLLLLVFVVAGGATAVAYYLGYIRLGGPQVAVNTAGQNSGPASGKAGSNETGTNPAGSEPSPGTTTGENPAETSSTGQTPDATGAPDATGPSDSAAPDNGVATLPDSAKPGELTDEPWAGLFDEKPPAAGPNPPNPATGDAQPAPADATNPGSQRWSVPSPEAQEAAKAAIRRIFYDDISAARTSQARTELAHKLISYAEQTKKDPAARYTLLALARDLAASAGESLLILQTVDQLAKEYQIDPLKMKAEAFQLAGSSAPSPQVLAGVMQTARQLIAEAMRQSRYEIAVELGEMCLTGARRLRSRDMVTECSVLLKDINTRKVRYEFAQRALETLQSNPEDPDANLALGKYLVITDRDWKKGLPHLAKGADERLAQAANLELSDLSDPRAKMALAEAWEGLSLACRGEEEEPLYRSRGIHWLQQALPQLDGLDKIAAAKRLEELGAAVDLTATAPDPAKAPKVNGPSAIEAPAADNTSDADLLDTIADQPATGSPPKKDPAQTPAAAPEDAKDPPKTPPAPPANPPATPPANPPETPPANPSGESVEDFFGPRPPKPAEDDGGNGFFGN